MVTDLSQATRRDKASTLAALRGKWSMPLRTAVYSGAGLIGYVELVIVKHNDEFSGLRPQSQAIGCRKENVRAGQPIAEMGRSGAARTCCISRFGERQAG